MKWKSILTLSIYTLLTLGCSINSQMLNRAIDSKYPKVWEEYGAYYEYSEKYINFKLLRFESNYPIKYYAAKPIKYNVILNKRLKILTEEGKSFGTIKLPKEKTIVRFHIDIRNSEGTLAPLDMDAVRDDYEEDGIVLLPDIKVGSAIDIYFEYLQKTKDLSEEHFFDEPIPIKKVKFQHTASENFRIGFTAYGPFGKADVSDRGNNIVRSWEAKNIMPHNSSLNTPWKDESVPRVFCRIEGYEEINFKRFRNNERYDVFKDWQRMASTHYDFFFNEAWFGSKKKVSEKAIELTNGLNDKEKKVDAILEYLQSNISIVEGTANLDGLFEKGEAKDKMHTVLEFLQSHISTVGGEETKPINLDRTLEKGEATQWEMTSLLIHMLETIGVEYRLLATRGHNDMGFVGNIPNPYSLQTPVVVIKDSVDYVAWPFEQDHLAGYVPTDYSYLQGVDLKTSKVHDIPPSKFKANLFYNKMKTSLHSKESSMSIAWVGAKGMKQRLEAKKKTGDENQVYFENLLSQHYDKNNVLIGGKYKNLEERSMTLSADLGFKNSEDIISKKGKVHKSLNAYFLAMYKIYNTERLSPWVNYEYEKTIEILDIDTQGKKVEYNFECENTDNKLFMVECSESQKGNILTLKRVVLQKPVYLSPKEMKAFYTEIQKLNKIKESWVKFI